MLPRLLLIPTFQKITRQEHPRASVNWRFSEVAAPLSAILLRRPVLDRRVIRWHGDSAWSTWSKPARCSWEMRADRQQSWLSKSQHCSLLRPVDRQHEIDQSIET